MSVYMVVASNIHHFSYAAEFLALFSNFWKNQESLNVDQIVASVASGFAYRA